MAGLSYAVQRRHRLKLQRLRDNPEATETAIVRWYEKQLEKPELTPEQRDFFEMRMDQALERLGAACGG